MQMFREIMHRSPALKFQSRLFSNRSKTQLAKRVIKPTCDVFLNHRGIDTKRTIATLLYDYLSRFNLRPFLDNKTMKPGDKLFEKIDSAIHGCKVGVAMFSPNYCQSYFCLHELALIMETKKKVIPIFCDIKPSQLRVPRNVVSDKKELRRFNWALDEAKNTVGLTFDSYKGNLSEVVTSASEIVIKSLIELENEERLMYKNFSSPNKTPVPLMPTKSILKEY
ncbi:TIR-only protein-like [Quercus robur]|uniref:TIR-only protein-like n=1 Tax=Quercus robur TaxID=38942 RepID=UPI0021616594|nr:TIR-only protein-like [Quercus robur]